MRAFSHEHEVCAIRFPFSLDAQSYSVMFFLCVLCLSNIRCSALAGSLWFERASFRLCYNQWCSSLRALPHKHWVCAVLLPSLPLVSRLIMLCTIQWCFVEVALPLKNRACGVLLLWLCELHAGFLGLYYHKRRNHRRKKGRQGKQNKS